MKTKFEQYLSKPETNLFGKLLNILGGFAFILVWTFCMSRIFYGPLVQFGFDYTWYILLLSCVVAPLWEEVAFRVIPLKLIAKSQDAIVPVMVASSMIFGYLHGGPINILFQGVMGFVMACVYVKNGYSYWSSVLLHAIWNFSVITGVIST